MSFLDHIKACNSANPAKFLTFLVGGTKIGSVSPAFSLHFSGFSDVFAVDEKNVRLREHLATPEQRSDALRAVLARLAAQGLLPPPLGEDFPVLRNWGETPLMAIDRRYVALFGLKAFGVHMNGIVRQGDQIKLWIGRRAADKLVEPNKLDNMVAGGQPVGLSVLDNLRKEAAEEAGLPTALVAQAKPVGAITYLMEGALGLKPDTLFLFDLEMPPDVIPRNTDGEISEFMLMDLDEAARRVRATNDFKFNVNLVLIDFLIRHGRLTPDEEPDYMALVTGLRGGH